jgi:hypothetical protein
MKKTLIGLNELFILARFLGVSRVLASQCLGAMRFTVHKAARGAGSEQCNLVVSASRSNKQNEQTI